MLFSLNQAAKETGKSPSTISRAIKSGRLSAKSKDDNGAYEIDPAELFRVYPQQRNPVAAQEMAQHATPKIEERNPREIELLERMNEDQRNTIEDLRNRLDDAQKEASQANERFSLWLEHKPDAPAQEEERTTTSEQAPRRWWQRKKDHA